MCSFKTSDLGSSDTTTKTWSFAVLFAWTETIQNLCRIHFVGIHRVTQKKRNPILIILNTRVPFFLGHPVRYKLRSLVSVYNVLRIFNAVRVNK